MEEWRRGRELDWQRRCCWFVSMLPLRCVESAPCRWCLVTWCNQRSSTTSSCSKVVEDLWCNSRWFAASERTLVFKTGWSSPTPFRAEWDSRDCVVKGSACDVIFQIDILGSFHFWLFQEIYMGETHTNSGCLEFHNRTHPSKHRVWKKSGGNEYILHMTSFKGIHFTPCGSFIQQQREKTSTHDLELHWYLYSEQTLSKWTCPVARISRAKSVVSTKWML